MGSFNDTKHADDAAETAPLLNHGNGAASGASRPPHRRRATSIASFVNNHVPKAHSPNTIVAIVCALIFVASASGGFFSIPITRIFEDRVCQEYYSGVRSIDGPIDEELCKVDVVQSRLASIFAVNSFIDAVVGCLVAMPWGLVADR
jgi:hypothetical protein